MIKNPEEYELIFNQARKLVPKARHALEHGDLKIVGRLMNENHRRLKEIEVSCSELNHLVDIALKNGAWGAKMTGSGLGGYMIALTPGAELQSKVANAINNKGFEVLKTTIGI